MLDFLVLRSVSHQSSLALPFAWSTGEPSRLRRSFLRSVRDMRSPEPSLLLRLGGGEREDELLSRLRRRGGDREMEVVDRRRFLGGGERESSEKEDERHLLLGDCERDLRRPAAREVLLSLRSSAVSCLSSKLLRGGGDGEERSDDVLRLRLRGGDREREGERPYEGDRLRGGGSSLRPRPRGT